MLFTVITFLAVTIAVAVFAWWRTRDDDLSTKDGYFLAGRSLTAPIIAGSLMLTNLSTEQIVGQPGQSYISNMGCMAWDVTSCCGLIGLALIFLPKYLKLGVTTVPEFLEERFDSTTKRIVSVLFLIGYMLSFLPTVLYSGALAFNNIFHIDQIVGVSQLTAVIFIAVIIGVIGSIYAIFGGLKAVAVSDTANGIGLIFGACIVPVMAFILLGNGSFVDGLHDFLTNLPGERFNAINPANATAPMIPWPVLFTGMMVNEFFYWGTHQAIIQRALGAKNLAEAQKGAIYAGFLKLTNPFLITMCGLIVLYFGQKGLLSADTVAALEQTSDLAYPTLVSMVLPKPVLGVFSAVLLGAVLSSFNSALNSCVTLYTLDIHRPLLNPNASDAHIVKVGKRFGTILAVVSIVVTPVVSLAPTGLYDFLQSCFGFYNVPILASVLIGMFSTRIPALAPKLGLILHVILYSISKFIPALNGVHYLYVLAVLFVFNVALQLFIGKIRPLETPFEMRDVHAVDMTPWKHAKLASLICMALLIGIYMIFSPLVLAA